MTWENLKHHMVRTASLFCLERRDNNQHWSILSMLISVASICGVYKCRVNDLGDRKKTDKFLVTCHRLDTSLPTYAKETAPDFFLKSTLNLGK